VLDLRLELIDVGAADATGQELRDASLEHRRRATELLADGLRLLDQAPQHSVLGALHVDEIAAVDFGRWLELAVDPAVPLLEPARIPGQVDVEQIAAVSLQIETLARGVGCDQDS
jgi:hypothetical protein